MRCCITKQFRGEITLIVDPAKLVDVILFLRSSRGLVYNYLSDISAVDYYPNDYGDSFKSDFRPERFGVSYHIYSMLYNRSLRVKAFAAEEDPKLPSLTPHWPAANWLEREIADMMGVKFEGHPDPEHYISERSDAEFSHSICPDCADRLYPHIALRVRSAESNK